MEIVGQLGMGRGWFVKSACRSALGVTPVIVVDPKGEWGGALKDIGGRMVPLGGPVSLDPLSFAAGRDAGRALPPVAGGIGGGRVAPAAKREV